MKLMRTALLALAASAAMPAAFAGPYGDALGACLSDHTSGKERKDLARWMFLGMTAHPEMKALSAARPEDKLAADQTMGRLVTRLISEDCTLQTRAVMEKEGSNGMQAAFGSLGRLAMQELMSNPGVNAAISAFEAHVDRAKVQAALAPR